MRLATTLFREYDVRGRVPEVFPAATDELSDEGVRHLGRAFGTLAKERGRTSVVLGYDLRTYSARLGACFGEGVAELSGFCRLGGKRNITTAPVCGWRGSRSQVLRQRATDPGAGASHGDHLVFEDTHAA